MEEAAQESKVSIESLDASLDDLLKAADAEGIRDKLSKAYGGVSIENSGHYTEGGTKGGGQAGSKDVGGIDRMMIGKMIGKLSESGFSDAQITAFMAGKQEEEEEEEEEDEEDEEMEALAAKAAYRSGFLAGKAGMDYDADDYSKSGDPTEGESFRKGFLEDEDIATAVDAAPFMEALTAKTTAALDSIRKSVDQGRTEQGDVNRALAGALYQQGQLLKSQAGLVGELSERLGIVERQPLPGKGATDLRGAQALHKGLPGEAGKPSMQLRKSELLSALSYLNLEKGQRQIGGRKTSEIITHLEVANQLDPSVQEHVIRFLSTHPNEAAAAKAYA